jgi:hypothetical protein
MVYFIQYWIVSPMLNLLNESGHSNQLVTFDGFIVFRCDRSSTAGAEAALLVNRSIKATLAYRSAAGPYFEYILVSLPF